MNKSKETHCRCKFSKCDCLYTQIVDSGSANCVQGACLHICEDLQGKYINVLLYLCNFSSLEHSSPFTLIL